MRGEEEEERRGGEERRREEDRRGREERGERGGGGEWLGRRSDSEVLRHPPEDTRGKTPRDRDL